MMISSDFLVECEECGKQIQIGKNDLEYESYSTERQMGTETEHEFRGYYTCEECQNDIDISVKGWEYPVGAINDEESSVTGGEFISEPQLSI